MTYEDMLAQFPALVAGIDEGTHAELDRKPLLAHYTTIEALEGICKNDELWFSNPLFMNDLEELRYGMNFGQNLVAQSKELAKACGSDHRLKTFQQAYSDYHSAFALKHALDVYVLCLSEHEGDDYDGRLSMWRAYGRNGTGVALVFNTTFVVERPMPIFLLKVKYASDEERANWLHNRLNIVCDVLCSGSIPDDKVYMLAYIFFHLVKIFSIQFKNKGFLEENEWRVVYLSDLDTDKILHKYFDYLVGPRGVEPKLKLPLKPLPIPPVASWTFDAILDRIILGPTASSLLAQSSMQRMLEKIGKPTFAAKVFASKIPLRPS